MYYVHLTIERKGGEEIEENLSAQEASEKERARLHEENVHQEWQKGTCPQKSKGQEDALILMIFKMTYTYYPPCHPQARQGIYVMPRRIFV